jgi:3-oxosteroid 1-dehydrogenase
MIEQTGGRPDHWNEEADFIVIGAGGAGLTAALVAAVEGARVVVLEKTELVGGTAALSGGGVWIPLNDHLADVGIEDSREQALSYLRAIGGQQTDEAILEVLVDRGAEMLRFLEHRAGIFGTIRAWPARGGTLDYRPWVPGAALGGRPLYPNKFRIGDLGEWGERIRKGSQSWWTRDRLDLKTLGLHAMRTSEFPPMAGEEAEPFEYLASGSALVAELLTGCLAHGVTIHRQTPAHEVVVEDGRVVGVRAQHAGDPLWVRARHGVMMATGGFGGSEELKRMWLSRPLELTCEIPENTGDGHLMGMAIGAQVANLGDAWWMPLIELGEDPSGAALNIGGTIDDRVLPHTIIVNRAGRRFVNESTNYYDFGEGFGLKSGAAMRNVPAWLLFDSEGREKYSALEAKAPAGEPPEWLTVAATLDEIATTVGIDAAGLASTVGRFNRFARDGHDEEFGRGENAWDVAWGDARHAPNPALGTLERPPFFAVEVKPGALATKGGLRVNGHGEVLSAAEPFEPIPGLYAAGNCSNAATAGAYPGPGCTLGAAMTFGYVIAQRVAAGIDVGEVLSR